MARPKTGKTPKKNMCLTVSEQTRLKLAVISEHYSESISALVSEWAAQEVKAINKCTGSDVLNTNHINNNYLKEEEL